MTRFHRPQPFYLVNLSAAQRHHAALDLVRPREIAHLLPHTWVSTKAIAEYVIKENRYIAEPRRAPDTWQSPGLTVRRGGGDCEDLSILAASLLVPVTHVRDVHLVLGPDHMWVEGNDEWGGFLLEATSGQVVRGYRPAQYQPDQVIEVKRNYQRIVV